MDLALLLYGISVIVSINEALIIGTILFAVGFACLTIVKMIYDISSDKIDDMVLEVISDPG